MQFSRSRISFFLGIALLTLAVGCAVYSVWCFYGYWSSRFAVAAHYGSSADFVKMGPKEWGTFFNVMGGGQRSVIAFQLQVTEKYAWKYCSLALVCAVAGAHLVNHSKGISFRTTSRKHEAADT
jgi:hypothetical protein